MSVANLLRQSATIFPKTGYNKFGRDTESGSTAVKCRFQNQSKTRLLPNQQVVVLDGIVYLDGAISISTEDRIVIGGVSYKAFSVNGAVDGQGNQRIIKVEVQRWQTA